MCISGIVPHVNYNGENVFKLDVSPIIFKIYLKQSAGRVGQVETSVNGDLCQKDGRKSDREDVYDV